MCQTYLYSSASDSHDALCQARSANASSRGKSISCSCCSVRTVSVHSCACIPVSQNPSCVQCSELGPGVFLFGNKLLNFIYEPLTKHVFRFLQWSTLHVSDFTCSVFVDGFAEQLNVDVVIKTVRLESKHLPHVHETAGPAETSFFRVRFVRVIQIEVCGRRENDLDIKDCDVDCGGW